MHECVAPETMGKEGLVSDVGSQAAHNRRQLYSAMHGVGYATPPPLPRSKALYRLPPARRAEWCRPTCQQRHEAASEVCNEWVQPGRVLDLGGGQRAQHDYGVLACTNRKEGGEGQSEGQGPMRRKKGTQSAVSKESEGD